MEKKTLTCIVCPLGCPLEITLDNGKVVSVTGNTCPRGKRYAEDEMTAPMRTLTSTVRINGKYEKLMPVKTTPMPKENIKQAMELINSIDLEAPIVRGTVIAEDFTAKGVKLIAGKTIE